jgi:hypothetical protein
MKSIIKEKIEMYQELEQKLIKEKEGAITDDRFKAINDILQDIRLKEATLIKAYDLLGEEK